MSLVKRIGRSATAQEALGFALAAHLRLVRATARIVLDPPDLFERIARERPAILAFWHGQHFMAPYFARPGEAWRVLASRHGDGAINAIACRHFGMGAVRASGGRPADMWRKGGVAGLREMLRSLKEGCAIASTADVPKVARIAGAGLIALARLSGRPIIPCAAVDSRTMDFASWDRASLPLPFGRVALMIGDPLRVPRDADEAAVEQSRLALQDALDRVQARAFARIGATDPGAELRARATAS